MKHLAILGSTGSIGRNTLEIIRRFPACFSAVALSTNSDIDTLYQQIKLFRPRFVCVKDMAAGFKLRSRLKGGSPRVFLGEEGLVETVKKSDIDMVVLAISGSGALEPLLKAIDNGKDIALANKEALVMAGTIIMERSRKKKVKIIPIDSEQSAIWQCLEGEDKTKIKNIYLTASGGPFREKSQKYLKQVSRREVLRHPRWKMGKKITVDSATLMNKGLELLEAMHLFGVGPEQIKVIIHPEAIIHSMVEFVDGVVMAQLSVTDMRIPIQYALSYPLRLESCLKGLDFCKVGSFNFQEPDFKRFPCLGFAYQAANDLGTAPCVLNAANETCVDAFLKKELDFIGIPKVIEQVMQKHRNVLNPDLECILAARDWAKEKADNLIKLRG